MSSPHFEAVRAILADILEIPADLITPRSSPDELEVWDSIRHLNFILAIESEFSLEFTSDEIESANDMPAILLLLANKSGS